MLVLAALLAACAAQVPNPKELYFEQTIDHFNFETSPQTFKQKYLLVDDFYKPGGPIFFYTGNEGPIWAFYNNTGFLFDIAPEFNALIVFAEHRYYGVSMPYGKDSYNKTTIGFLTIEQALADYAVLLLDLKPKYNNAHVVTFGGSYGGMLSGWMRMKYPFIVDMALAASAPYRVASLQVEPTAVFETITQTVAAANPECPNLIRGGFAELIALSEQGQSGLDELTRVFKLCTPLTPSQVHHLKLWAVNAFPTLGMCNYPYPADFMAPLPAWPVNYACELALQASSPLEALAVTSGLLYNGTDGTLPCFNIESEFIECADQSGCGTGPSGHSWDYQACTELIWFLNTNNVTDMFPPRNWTHADLKAYCGKTFDIVPRPTWLLEEFGSGNISTSATHIIFSNGLLDPWHVGGFLSNLSDTLPAVVIAEGAHHLDLRASNPLDPQSVIDARLQEVAYLKQWLSELDVPAKREEE